MCLIHFIVLVLHDLIPTTDKTFKYLKLLQELVENVMQDEFDEQKIIKLDNLIEKLNTLYFNLFGSL